MTGSQSDPQLFWIEAKIIAIMETWPLEIRLISEGQELMFELDENALIESEDAKITPNDLHQEDRIKAEIQSPQGAQGIARIIHIIKIN